MERFQAIFQIPKTLTLQRDSDHQIKLKLGMSPIKQQPYRYPYQRQEIEKIVIEMLEQGVIQPSGSPFSSLVLLVKKKDKSYRFCVD